MLGAALWPPRSRNPVASRDDGWFARSACTSAPSLIVDGASSLAGLRVRHNSCMATDPSTPLPLRPSVADRERVARILRDRSVEGRLSLDTYSERIERLYGARNHDELDELVCDVQPAAAPRRLLLGLVEWVSRIVADVEAAWERPRLPVIALPMGRVTIGRAPDCDCVISEPTVSRHHAELWRDGERWLVRDLGSRNGTRVNGIRVLEPTEVHPGDRVALGEARHRLASPRSLPRPD
jgi:FHA domain/Domain of unknown function (DUF1707)